MARDIRVRIIGDSSSLSAALARASSQAGGFGSKMAGALGLAAKAVAAGSVAMGAGLGYVIQQAANFQDELNTFQSVSQATGAQMKQVSSLAKKLGSDISLPATSASDAAKAMVELSKAGLKTKDVMGAAKGVLQLSAAAEVDNATAAQIAANNLNAFHLAGTKATHVADLLAAASIAASGSMTDMADGLSMVAATAAQAHVPIEDTVAAIGEMANKGIQGGEAGAALQQMLLKLESPTKKGAAALKDLGVKIYDAHGAMRPMPDLIDQFSKATSGMSDAQRNAAMNALFGSRAIRAANIVLLGGKDAFDKMRGAVDRQGAAADVAKAKMKGFHGSLQALQSSVETLAIDLGTPLLGPLATAARGLAGLVSNIDAAKGGKAKIQVVLDAAQDLGKMLEQKIGAAVAAVNWTAVWAKAAGLAAGLEKAFESINWTTVGSSIGRGFSGAVDKAISATSGLPSAFERAFKSIDWNKLGRSAGPGLAAAVVSAFAVLTSPGFWLKNWDLALAVALTAFTGPIGRLAGRLLIPFRGAIVNLMREVGLVIAARGGVIGELLVRAVLKLPGLVSSALSPLTGLVSNRFAKLGSLARFTVKVLGIQAAIQAVVQMAQSIWNAIKALPGQMVSIGTQIPAGLAAGIRAGIGAVVGAVTDMVGSIPGYAKKLLHIGSPSRVMAAIGESIGEGLALGILQSASKAQSAVVSAVGRTVRAAQAEVRRIQAGMDAEARRREDADNARGLREAEAAVAQARKKGKGVADAERQLADAQQAIRDTAAQRELDRAQRHLDTVQAQFDKAQARLQAAQQRAADKLAALRDKALAAFDKVAAKIQKAFDAKNGAWVSPAQAAIDAITGRRRGEDLQQAVTDAQKALADAIAGGDSEQILAAQRQLQRAQEDIQLESLGQQAADQSKAHDESVGAQQEQLDLWIGGMRSKIEEGKGVWTGSIPDMLAGIRQFDGDFNTVGDTLGKAFADGLLAQVNAAGAAVAALTGGSVGAGRAVRPDDRAGPRGAVPHLQFGGRLLSDGLFYGHRGETVMPAGGGVTKHVHVHFDGPVYGDKNAIEQMVVSAVTSANRRGNLLTSDLR